MTESLAEVLAVEQLDEGLFQGKSLTAFPGRVFGGQVLAQAVVAAGRTVAPARAAHSLHGYFLRTGDPALPIEYRVEPVRDGASFTTRRVVAEQNGGAIFQLLVSFHEAEDGLSHQIPRADTPYVDDRPALTTDHLETADPRTRAWFDRMTTLFPVDIRFAEEPARVAIARNERPAPRQRVFLRCPSPLNGDPLLHLGAAVFFSDMLLLSTSLLPHGLVYDDPRVRGLSLDHSMWIHGEVRADDWMLYEMESSWSGRGRALCHGRLFGHDGALLATVVQEGLVRFAPDPA